MFATPKKTAVGELGPADVSLTFHGKAGEQLDELTDAQRIKFQESLGVSIVEAGKQIRAGKAEVVYNGDGRFSFVPSDIAERIRAYRKAQLDLERIQPISSQAGDLFQQTSFLVSPLNRYLGARICRYLGVKPLRCAWTKFDDDEGLLNLQENVRGKHVFFIQGFGQDPTRQMERMVLGLDALKRAAAQRVTLVTPYFGYGRQERREERREPISAAVIASVARTFGAQELFVMDLHAPQIQGFFDGPMSNLFPSPTLVPSLCERISMENVVFVGADSSAYGRATALAELSAAYCQYYRLPSSVSSLSLEKYRDKATKEVVRPADLRADVQGKTVIVADDMVTTGSTAVPLFSTLLECGAREVHLVATHGGLVRSAFQRLSDSPVKTVFFSNTIPTLWPMDSKFVMGDAGEIFADAIFLSSVGGSLMGLRRTIYGRQGERLYVGARTKRVEHVMARGDLTEYAKFDPNSVEKMDS